MVWFIFFFLWHINVGGLFNAKVIFLDLLIGYSSWSIKKSNLICFPFNTRTVFELIENVNLILRRYPHLFESLARKNSQPSIQFPAKPSQILKLLEYIKKFRFVIFKNIRTINLTFIIKLSTFQPKYFSTLFRCFVPNPGDHTKFRTEPFIWTTGIDYSNYINHDRIHVLSYSKYSLLFLPIFGIEPATSRWFHSEALSNRLINSTTCPCRVNFWDL